MTICFCHFLPTIKIKSTSRQCIRQASMVLILTDVNISEMKILRSGSVTRIFKLYYQHLTSSQTMENCIQKLGKLYKEYERRQNVKMKLRCEGSVELKTHCLEPWILLPQLLSNLRTNILTSQVFLSLSLICPRKKLEPSLVH